MIMQRIRPMALLASVLVVVSCSDGTGVAQAADPPTATITATPTAIPSDGASTSTITVQLKDGAGTNLTTGGATVALSTTLGTLGAVTDNLDGTYTATLTAGVTAGTATITGTLNGTAITNGAAVTFFVADENFDTDPGWTRFNNPANGNDFGFQDSNLAGGTAGEAGGFFSVTNVPVWYGDDTIGNFGGDDALSASGILNILSIDVDADINLLIGHFDNGGFSEGNHNGIGFEVLEPRGGSSIRIVYHVGIASGLMFRIDDLGLSRTWSYNYDPSAGSFGSLTVSISGPGGGTVTRYTK